MENKYEICKQKIINKLLKIEKKIKKKINKKQISFN